MHYVQAQSFPRPDSSQLGPEIYAQLIVAFDPTTAIGAFSQLQGSARLHSRLVRMPVEAVQATAWMATILSAFDPTTELPQSVDHRLDARPKSVALEWVQGSPVIYHPANAALVPLQSASTSQAKSEGAPRPTIRLSLHNQSWIQETTWVESLPAFDPTLTVAPTTQQQVVFPYQLPTRDVRYQTRGGAFGIDPITDPTFDPELGPGIWGAQANSIRTVPAQASLDVRVHQWQDAHGWLFLNIPPVVLPTGMARAGFWQIPVGDDFFQTILVTKGD